MSRSGTRPYHPRSWNRPRPTALLRRLPRPRGDRAHRARRLPDAPRLSARRRARRHGPGGRHRGRLRSRRCAPSGATPPRSPQPAPLDAGRDRRAQRHAGDDGGPHRHAGPRRPPSAPSRPAGASTTWPPATSSDGYVGNLAPALKDIYGDEVFDQLADILGAADNYPELSQPPAWAQVPQLVISDIISPLTPKLDGDVKVFELTIDEIEHQVDEKTAPEAAARLQQAVARPHDPGHRGRQGPGDLHEQPEGDDRGPFPRGRLRQLLHGRRPVRDPEADRARRDVHLRVRGKAGRLDDVPLAPQRHRPGGSRAPRAPSSSTRKSRR